MIPINAQAIHDLAGDRVFVNRPVRPDLPNDALPRFADATWDLNVGMFEEHATKFRINFTTFPPTMQEAVRVYFWTLINEDELRRVPGAPAHQSRLALPTIALIQSPLRRLLEWCTHEGMSSLHEAGPAVLDRFLAQLADDGLGYAQKRRVITETRRLWVYRALLPAELRLPEESPWLDELTSNLIGTAPRRQPHNLTPRIDDDVLVPLLSWAFRFVETFAPDITHAYHEYRRLQSRSYRHSRPVRTAPVVAGARVAALNRTLSDLRYRGLGLPGVATSGRSAQINWTHLGRLTGYHGSTHATYDRAIVSQSGLPIDPDSYLLTERVALLEEESWHPQHIAWSDAVRLADHLTTACFVVIAYLSGMRPGEILNLRPDCLSYDERRGHWEIRATRWKGARTPDGEKIPEGELRDDPWVVHPITAQAIDVLRQLHPADLLFPARLELPTIRGNRPRTNGRTGTARTTPRMTTAIQQLVAWVNSYCTARGRTDTIPDGPNRRVVPSQFRRTLAWHIVRRPRGLVAAAVQYGHIATHITQGYSGNYASGFPSDLAMERWLERIENVANLDHYLGNGGTVSGPAAAELRIRTTSASAKFLGRHMPTSRQAEKLLADPALQVFKGLGMHCVFTSTTALCTRETDHPSLSNCSGKCRNIARTDDDIAELEQLRSTLATDTLAPPIRYERIRTITSELTATIDQHMGGTEHAR